MMARIVPLLVAAYGTQIACALYFVPRHDDRFFDLCGTAGFLTTTFTSLYYPAIKARLWEGRLVPWPTIAPRQLLLTAVIGIWSLRLGGFLVQRTLKTGGDSRFVEIKKNPKRFLPYWVGQGTWNFLVGLPVYLVNMLPAKSCPPLRILDYLATSVIVSCFILEVTADLQKAAWRRAKDQGQHNEKFISRGLWALSRHPNYVGEVGIWTGIWLLSIAALQHPSFPTGTTAFTLASPLFTWMIVRHVTGVPSLERHGDEKWRDDPKWQEYKRTVPIFWPWRRS